MTNGQGIETPANKIATAQALLNLAFRLNAEVIAGRINSEIYKHTVSVITSEAGNTGITLPAFPEGTDEDLKSGIGNLVLIALSATALTTDETLNEVFGGLSGETDNNRQAIRIMINQLRNAFAHNPWRAKWLIFPKYRNIYPIILDDGSAFTFDSTSLNGQGIKPEQVGGLEFWVKLLQHCERLVS
jgi:hypothetical protein